MSCARLSTFNPVDGHDKYTEGIDFSNACREFYMNRVKATENFKKQMKSNSPSEEKPTSEVPRKKSSIESAMEKLRSEMVSLMDQDLCLMRQLLTLNEAIEDIKTKRLYGMSKNSLHADSRDMSASEWSLSDTDLYASDEEIDKSSTDTTSETQKDTSFLIPKPKTESNFVKTDILVNGKPVHCIHGVQRSIDSGYDESDTYQTDIEVSL